jgi:hypothetical protein
MYLAVIDGMLLKTQVVRRNLFQTGGSPFTPTVGKPPFFRTLQTTA